MGFPLVFGDVRAFLNDDFPSFLTFLPIKLNRMQHELPDGLDDSHGDAVMERGHPEQPNGAGGSVLLGELDAGS